MDSKISDFLKAAQIGVISTGGPDGASQSAAVGVTALDNGLEIVIGTSVKSRKYRNISADSRASLTVFEGTATVQLEGRIEILQPDDARLADYQRRVIELRPFMQKFADDPEQSWLIFRPSWARYTDIKPKPWEVIEQDLKEKP